MACPPGHIQIRRDIQATWYNLNPYLLPGEFAYSTDSGILKIGPGYWRDANVVGGGGATGATGPTGPAGTSFTTLIATGSTGP